MPSNMIKGSEILASANGRGKKIVDTQTAKQAVKNIKKKYGNVVKTGMYYHRGNGNWARYSKDLDAKRDTGIRANPKYRKNKKAHKGDSNKRYKGERI